MHLDKGFNVSSLMGGAGEAIALCMCMSMVGNLLGAAMDGMLDGDD